MSAGATAPETPEFVANSVISPLSNRTSRLPPEVWERIIGWIPYHPEPGWKEYSPLSRSTLLACTLVCRSWLHKSQHLLFPLAVLTNANQANSFIAALRTSPSLGRNVEGLEIGPVKRDSGGTSKPPSFCSWIHPLLNTLPPLLPNVKQLTFRNLPTMHKSFFVLAPQFKSVTHLYLEDLVNQSFSEIIRLVNHFPHLQRLDLFKCLWRQPAHYYSGIQHRLQQFIIQTDGICEMNGPKWLLASHSTSALTHLWVNNWIDSALMVEVDQILKQCTSTLQVLRLCCKNDISLKFPTLATYTSLEFIQFYLPIERLGTFAYQVSVPSSLLMFYLNFQTLFEEVFETQYQTVWETIDTIFSDSRLKSLGHFVIWTKSKQVDNFEKERISILEKILPKLFKKDILWWGDMDTEIAYHVSLLDQRSLAWQKLSRNYL